MERKATITVTGDTGGSSAKVSVEFDPPLVTADELDPVTALTLRMVMAARNGNESLDDMEFEGE